MPFSAIAMSGSYSVNELTWGSELTSMVKCVKL